MPTFLVEAYAPPAVDVADVEARAREAAAALSDEGVAVTYVRPILVRRDETCFHLIESVSETGVLELIRRASLSFIRIAEAQP